MENKDDENKKEKKSINKSIIVMRHGERIDCIDGKINQLLSENDRS